MNPWNTWIELEPAPAIEPAPEPETTDRPPLEPRRILIVDDDALVRSSLAAVLHAEGYDVHGAADGRAAVLAAIDYRPDLVLLDLNLPGMDGWTTFTRLESVRPLLPVIVLTARPN